MSCNYAVVKSECSDGKQFSVKSLTDWLKIYLCEKLY